MVRTFQEKSERKEYQSMKAQARAELKEQDKEGKLICDNWYRIDRLIVPQSTKTTRPVKEPYE